MPGATHKVSAQTRLGAKSGQTGSRGRPADRTQRARRRRIWLGHRLSAAAGACHGTRNQRLSGRARRVAQDLLRRARSANRALGSSGGLGGAYKMAGGDKAARTGQRTSAGGTPATRGPIRWRKHIHPRRWCTAPTAGRPSDRGASDSTSGKPMAECSQWQRPRARPPLPRECLALAPSPLACTQPSSSKGIVRPSGCCRTGAPEQAAMAAASAAAPGMSSATLKATTAKRSSASDASQKCSIDRSAAAANVKTCLGAVATCLTLPTRAAGAAGAELRGPASTTIGIAFSPGGQHFDADSSHSPLLIARQMPQGFAEMLMGAKGLRSFYKKPQGLRTRYGALLACAEARLTSPREPVRDLPRRSRLRSRA